MMDLDMDAASRRAAVLQSRYQTADSSDASPQVWIYCDQTSAAPGDHVRLFVSTNQAHYDVIALRDGVTPAVVWQSGKQDGLWQAAPVDCSVQGCDWTDTGVLSVAEDWPSGAYRLVARGLSGDGSVAVESEGLLLVRPSTEVQQQAKGQGRLLLVASTCTWWAYNSWGGSNHYDGICGPSSDHYAPVVSLNRPFDKGFVSLPSDAPRVRLPEPPAYGAPLRYPHMEWAYQTGHSRKYASAGWASYESHFWRWAERDGLAVDLIAQSDLVDHPEILPQYGCCAFVGHDEYWTWDMRDAVDDYVERGGRIARFAGNFLWQCRLDSAARQQTCHKYEAAQTDLMVRSDTPHLTTTAWEAPIVGRPAALTFGLEGSWGIYAGWGKCGVRGVRGFPLYRPDHWAFEGTGLGYGDLLGEPSGAFGYETDGLDYIIRHGLPEPAEGISVPEDLTILALGLATTGEVPGPEDPDYPAFIGDMETKFIAQLRYGTDSAQACADTLRGNGMIVEFSKGRGKVFHAGTCNWVAGLTGIDPAIEQVTRTVLRQYLANG
jgi:hypothetical protein